MSSESRNEQLEGILSAKFDLEHCDDEEKSECSKNLDRLISETLAIHPNVSRLDLIEAIRFKYREYKALRLKAQRRKETL